MRGWNWPWELATLKAEGFTLVALTPRDRPSTSLCARRQRGGNGASGRRRKPRDYSRGGILADVRVRIPMSPAVDSLNLATASGIALYHLTLIRASHPNP